MGGVGKALFGSPEKKSGSSSSQSGNYAYPSILSAYGPAMGYTSAAGNMMGNLLGLNTGASSTPTPSPTPTPTTGGGGTLADRKRGLNSTTSQTAPVAAQDPYTPVGDGISNQNAALENWSNSGGMKFIIDQGVKALEGSQAGKGIYQSGDTLKELTKYGQGLGSTYLNQYMNQLLEHARLGIQAGGLIGSTGTWNKSSGQESGSGAKQGIAPSLVSAAAGIPGISDYRVKKNIQYVFTNSQGLNIYDYDFNHPELPKGRHRGPMAQEVRKVLPSAFIPNLWGKYHGVDYAQVKGL